MKYLFFTFALVLLGSYAVSVWAANQPTPAVKPAITPLSITSPGNDVALRSMNQMRLVSVALKNGKITQQQAANLRASLKSIHLQTATYIRASANHQLTTTQQSQLNSLLNQNSQALGETPVTN